MITLCKHSKAINTEGGSFGAKIRCNRMNLWAGKNALYVKTHRSERCQVSEGGS